MKKIYAFDFDGTLTHRDSLIAFLVYAKGWKEVLKCMALHFHLLIAMKAGIIAGGKVKERIFDYFFNGMAEDDFNALCHRFARDNSGIIREKARKKLRELQAVGTDDIAVMVVSASINNWVEPFFRDMPDLKVVGTRIEVKDGKLTGKFLSANCRRIEKVRRILALYPNRDTYYLTAYGDSSGDIEMLNFADEAHYKPFRR